MGVDTLTVTPKHIEAQAALQSVITTPDIFKPSRLFPPEEEVFPQLFASEDLEMNTTAHSGNVIASAHNIFHKELKFIHPKFRYYPFQGTHNIQLEIYHYQPPFFSWETKPNESTTTTFGINIGGEYYAHADGNPLEEKVFNIAKISQDPDGSWRLRHGLKGVDQKTLEAQWHHERVLHEGLNRIKKPLSRDFGDPKNVTTELSGVNIQGNHVRLTFDKIAEGTRYHLVFPLQITIADNTPQETTS